MTKNNEKVKVRNRSGSVVVYKLNDTNIRRVFSPGEEKTISRNELVELSYQPGGKTLLANFLQIKDLEAIKEVDLKVEPEYHLTEAQIIELLEKGSIEAFKDCLDFAPEGVIDLIKSYSVELELNDSMKRDAIKAKTGFDVTQAIVNKKADKEPEEEAPKEEAPARRVKTEEAPASRRTVPNYNVVS